MVEKLEEKEKKEIERWFRKTLFLHEEDRIREEVKHEFVKEFGFSPRIIGVNEEGEIFAVAERYFKFEHIDFKPKRLILQYKVLGIVFTTEMYDNKELEYKDWYWNEQEVSWIKQRGQFRFKVRIDWIEHPPYLPLDD
jgi:hypothetical protein